MGASASASPLGEGLRSSIAGGSSGGGGALSAEHSISWSFLDENGVHEVEMFHGRVEFRILLSENLRTPLLEWLFEFDGISVSYSKSALLCECECKRCVIIGPDALAGTRRALLNGCIVGASTSFSPLEAGDIYTFQAGRHRCIVHAKPDSGQFHYSMSVDGVAIAEFNQRLWSHCTRWFFNIDQIPHSCVVLHDSRFAIIVDGTVVDAASSFLDDGSRHSLTVMGREFVLDCHATLPAPSTLGPNDIAAGSLNSKASLFKMHADASFVSDAATGISSPMKLHPIPRGSILHDGATTPAPSQQSNAKREHYALYVDGELIQPDIETRMPQPYLALGRHIQHRALKTAGSRQSADC